MLTVAFVLLAFAAATHARLDELIHGFPCNGVDPRRDDQVCRYKGQNETDFQALRSTNGVGPISGTGLNGTENFVLAWSSSHGGARARLIDGTGKSIKEIDFAGQEGDTTPTVVPLSHRGFAVSVAQADGDVRTATFDQDGDMIMQWTPVGFQRINQPTVMAGLSEDRYVILARDELQQLWASVWYKTERVTHFKVSADCERYEVVALSGDSYVIMLTTTATNVRLLAFRVTSQEEYTIENVDANGEISSQSDFVSVSALDNNFFTAVVTRTPDLKLFTYNFKDAKELRQTGDPNSLIRVLSPQTVAGKTHASDVASPARVAWREGGFVVTYATTGRAYKALAFQRQGITNGTEIDVHAGPAQLSGGFAAATEKGGFVTSFIGEDEKAAVKFYKPADFGEIIATTTTQQQRKRQTETTTTAEATTTTAAPTTTTEATTTTAAPTTTTTTAAPTTTTTTTTTTTKAATTTTTTKAAGTTTTTTKAAAAETTTKAAAEETTTTAEADDGSDEVMTETGSTEAFEGALAAPIVFTLSNKNIVAVWTSAHEQADADAYQGFNGHFTILSQTGEEISEPQMIVEDGSIMDRTDSNAITSGVASFTLQLAAALIAALALIL